jgi:hypothetical protein
MKGITGARLIPLVLLLAVALPPPAALLAQEELAPPDSFIDHGWRLNFLIGWSQLDLDELNSTLEAAGYSPFSGSSMSLGGGLSVFINRWWVSLSGLYNFAEEGSGAGGDLATSLSSSSLSVQGGYVVFASGGLRLFPLIGVGADFLRLKISDAVTTSFSEVLADPTGSQLKLELFLFELGLGADFVTPMWLWFAPITLGARGGYRSAFSDDRWTLDDGSELSGGPKLEREGPFVQLQIGLAF